MIAEIVERAGVSIVTGRVFWQVDAPLGVVAEILGAWVAIVTVEPSVSDTDTGCADTFVGAARRLGSARRSVKGGRGLIDAEAIVRVAEVRGAWVAIVAAQRVGGDAGL